VLAQMIGYGQSVKAPTDPRVLKAILLASADKVYDSNGDPWTPRHQYTRKGRIAVDQPLDDEQGAGRLDAVAAYRIYTKSSDSKTAKGNWAFTSLKRYRTFSFSLGHVNAGQQIDTSMAWDYHVGRTDNGNRVIDPGDKFYENVPLADFALSLIKDGRVIATSDSLYDNVELLSYKVTAGGNYAIEVYRHKEWGNRNETFAVAAHVLNTATLQRSIAASDAAYYTSGGVQRSVEVVTPEPSTALVLVAFGGLASCRRRRRRA
jgi:hypothetical protein